MVSTRSRKSLGGAQADDNRMIVVVTGANSGFGFGICQQLLRNLSLPPGTTFPASVPQKSALAPSQYHLLDSAPATKHVPGSPPPTLTLILACRSQRKAEEAKELLLSEHKETLAQRAHRNEPVRDGWSDGLRIVWEGIDLDAMDGPNGTLTFCQRISDTYPHITTIFLNAGATAYSSNSYPGFAFQLFTQGPTATLSAPEFAHETAGLLSADRERGYVWGVNVFSPYVIAKDLVPLLRRSPRTLPFPPRIIYTSSCTASRKNLSADPMSDYQLLKYGETLSTSIYKASKYSGDLVMLQLDKQLAKETEAGEAEVRVLNADPGCAVTSIFDKAFGSFAFYRSIMKFFYWLAFFMARVLGSTVHPVYSDSGALSMLYAALIDERYLQPPSKVPGQKFLVHSHRWGKTTVDYGEVDQWEAYLGLGEDMVEACAVLHKQYRRRQGLE